MKGLLTTDPPSEWARMTSDEVTRRNRYQNVDPFSSNRVRLKVPEGQNDYINASPITLKSVRTGKRKDYIATQVGLLPCLILLLGKSYLGRIRSFSITAGPERSHTQSHLAHDLARDV